MKLGFVYAGQGSQHPGMGADLYETYPAFRAVFDQAELDIGLKLDIGLTAFRGQAMEASAAGHESAMMAVLGMERNALQAVCDEASSKGCVVVQVQGDPWGSGDPGMSSGTAPGPCGDWRSHCPCGWKTCGESRADLCHRRSLTPWRLLMT